MPAGWDAGDWRLWLFRHSPWGVLFEFAAGVALYQMFGRVSDDFAKPLAHPWLVYVGTVSYSLYLFHFVVPMILPHGGALHFVVAIGLAVAVATGIYRLVEVPGRRVIRSVADRLLMTRDR